MRMVVTAAARHRAEVEAGTRLDAQGLGQLVQNGDRAAFARQWGEAATQLRRALLFCELLLGDGHVWSASVRARLGYVLAAQGDAVGAEEQWALARAFFSPAPAPSPASRKRQRRTGRAPAPASAAKLSLEQVASGAMALCGEQAQPCVLRAGDLTPRSARVCAQGGVSPARLQERDRHSFYAAGVSFAAQEAAFGKHRSERASLLEALLTDRHVLILEEQSEQRQRALEQRLEREREEKAQRKFRRRSLQDGVRRPALEPAPILRRDGKGTQQNQSGGAYEAATAIAIERQLACPSCATVYDFTTARCRTCSALVDWAAVVRRSELQFGPLPAVLVDPSPLPSCLPALQARLAVDPRRSTPPGPGEAAALRYAMRHAGGLNARIAKHEQGSGVDHSGGWADGLCRARARRADQDSAMVNMLARQHEEELRLLQRLDAAKPTDRLAEHERARLLRAAAMDDWHVALDARGALEPSQKVSDAVAIYRAFA
jgi:hypothetical protein